MVENKAIVGVLIVFFFKYPHLTNGFRMDVLMVSYATELEHTSFAAASERAAA